MGLFSALVKTAIETVQTPLDVAKDVCTLGNSDGKRSFTHTRLKRIKEAASDKDESEMTEEESFLE